MRRRSDWWSLSSPSSDLTKRARVHFSRPYTGSTARFDPRDQTRRTSLQPHIAAAFELEETDRQVLTEIPSANEVLRCTIHKSEEGRLSVVLDPEMAHDLRPRDELSNRWTEIRNLLPIAGTKEQKQERRNLLSQVGNILGSDKEWLGEERIQKLDAVAAWLRGMAEQGDSPESEDERRTAEAVAIEGLAAHERACPPAQARSALLQRKPRFLMFGDEARNLRETYDLADMTDDPPVALGNLARLAGLDVTELLDATRREDIPHVQELIEEANAKLEEVFAPAWIRDDVVPVLQCDGTIVHLMVRSPDRGGLSWIDERSDGLRWFVALLAFLNAETEPGAAPPVLLVDEAESHLSYDAQASLIDVLEAQDLASRVIYTTHSAGCLPSDLGTGIRPVVPLHGERSTIQNAFWTEGPGFSPLLLAMGLGPLAFTVARNQLVAEGPSESLLLPTLIREASGEARLPYQVAPGAATVAPDALPDLLSEGGRVAFVLDADDAGKTRAQLLLDSGVEEGLVTTYEDYGGDGLVFEDLVDSQAYVEAFNEELVRWQQADVEITVDDLGSPGRAAKVDAWCEERGLKHINKPLLCQRLAEMGSAGRSLVGESQRELLIGLHAWAVRQFSAKNPSD